MGRRLFFAFAIFVLGGCFALFPMEEYRDEDKARTSAAPDGSTADVATTVGNDAGVDSSAPCITQTILNDAGGDYAASALPSGQTITLDGVLDEWACVPFMRVDQAHYGWLHTIDGGTENHFDFAVKWDPQHLWFAMHVDDRAPHLGTSDQPFLNDSVEVYLDGDGVLSTTYQADTVQWVVDHANAARKYVNGSPLPPGPNARFASAVKANPLGYDVEVRIDAAEVVRTSFAPGLTLGFDFAGNESDGVTQKTQLGWYYPKNIVCGGGTCCSASCNPSVFGRLFLAP